MKYGVEPTGAVFALFREISGYSSQKHPAGEVWVTDLGLLAATIESFHMKRLAVEQGDALLYAFTAECRTVSPAIIADDEYVKDILVRIGGKQYRVEPKAGQRMVLYDRTRLKIGETSLCLKDAPRS